MKMTLTALAFVLSALASQSAGAMGTILNSDNVAPGTCGMAADLEVNSIGLVIGVTSGQGTGLIRCVYLDGDVEEIPVHVTVSGGGIMAGAKSVKMGMLSTGIGIGGGGAMALTGRYTLLNASAHGLILGGGGGAGLELRRDQLSIPVEFQLQFGPGLELAPLQVLTYDIVPARVYRPFRRN